MKGVFIFLAEGFEEIEALATVDILRRGGINARTVSINTDKEVKGAHGVPAPLFDRSTFQISMFAQRSLPQRPSFAAEKRGMLFMSVRFRARTRFTEKQIPRQCLFPAN